ncbi:tRNA lysidine(34) synthetase TilS [Brachybacterium phenoliresistens]|uniref:tRNA lysidine(34) synthetase TilS n=1 Tax=Brachybacterium phenoliresistens TaxID=396014 RepID=UPI0031CEF7E3
MAGPPRVVARARTAVRAHLTARLEQLADDTGAGHLSPRVLVGVSGGADSLALLATTAWVAARMGLETEALIIDHGLQADSAGVAERAAEASRRLGAAHTTIRRVEVGTAGAGGVENAARRARHAAFTQRLDETGALALLLGHTLDDQAEQVLMGLARGGGPRAMAGIPPVRGAILRPFLGAERDESTALRRADTEEICRVHDVEWWEDPMNEDPALLRSAVRHRVLPLLREVLGEQIDENLARAAALIGPDVEHLDAEAAARLEELRRDGGELREDGDLLLLDAYALASVPAALRTRILRDASRRAEQEAGTPSDKSLLRRHVLAAEALVVSWHGQAGVPLPGRIEVARRDGLLVWRRLDP